jgi:hypothetical protein
LLEPFVPAFVLFRNVMFRIIIALEEINQHISFLKQASTTTLINQKEVLENHIEGDFCPGFKEIVLQNFLSFIKLIYLG